MLRDKAALCTMLGQSITVAVLLIMVFKGDATATRSLNFLLVVASIWFGCNSSAKEIVKERTVYSRERNVGLQVSSYYSSKFLVLSVLSITQATLLLGLVSAFCAFDDGTNFVREWIILSAQAFAGVAIGLMISAWSETEDQAVAFVPMALLPQLILGGGVAPLKEGTLVRWLARSLVTTYSGFDAISAKADGYATLAAAFAVIGVHICAVAAAAVVFLDLRDRREGRYTRALDRWRLKARA